MSGCALCGRRRRAGRELCSTCRVLIGPMIATTAALPDAPRSRGCSWRLRSSFPRELRRSWSDDAVREAHARYVREGVRVLDDLTVAMESEYQRRRRAERVALAVQAAS